MRYLPHSQEDIEAMLEVIDKPCIKSLFNCIDDQLQLKDPLKLPKNLSEMQLMQQLKNLAGSAPKLSFLGAGVNPHFVPQAVNQMLLRSEWYTAYTPYQAEVSQGTLQAIFEFQTIVSSIYGCDVANASMYDGATALAEAVLMASRVKKQPGIALICDSVHPHYKEVCQNLVENKEITLIYFKHDRNGTADLDHLTYLLKQYSDKVISVIYQTPNFLGQLEKQSRIIDLAHSYQALAIAVNTEPAAMALIEPPGNYGADIVVGEGIGFCGHMSLGGPGVGLFCCKKELLRQMPGRIVGQTKDVDNKRGFVLTLSTREQHIRRQRATSNICSNHNLMAIAFSMALSLYGQNGFKNLAKKNLQKTFTFRKLAKSKGLNILFGPHYFNETVIKFDSDQILTQIIDNAAQEDIHIGVKLSQYFKQYDGCLLVHTSELHSSEDLDVLINYLA